MSPLMQHDQTSENRVTINRQIGDHHYSVHSDGSVHWLAKDCEMQVIQPGEYFAAHTWPMDVAEDCIGLRKEWREAKRKAEWNAIKMSFTFDELGNILSLEAMRRAGFTNAHGDVQIDWKLDGLTKILGVDATILNVRHVTRDDLAAREKDEDKPEPIERWPARSIPDEQLVDVDEPEPERKYTYEEARAGMLRWEIWEYSYGDENWHTARVANLTNELQSLDALGIWRGFGYFPDVDSFRRWRWRPESPKPVEPTAEPELPPLPEGSLEKQLSNCIQMHPATYGIDSKDAAALVSELMPLFRREQAERGG